tara:strand:- start:520 stop:939 length:420 start_codon:yes stop_codon:yes gene_type:complete
VNCNKCGSENIGTLDTRRKYHSSFSQVQDFFESGENIIRKKKCQQCGHTFFTKEFFLETVEERVVIQKVVEKKPQKKITKVNKPKPKPKQTKPKVKNNMRTKEKKHESTDSIFDEIEDLEDRVNLDDIGKELGIDFGKD